MAKHAGGQRADAAASPGARTASAAADLIEADICVIGAGAGGLKVASAAAAVGQRVVLIEKHKMGGSSLNYGCVPSKALLAAARRAHEMRSAAPFGIAAVDPAIDFSAVRAHVAGVVSAIAPNDAAERFTAMGVKVVHATARFADKATVEAGELRIKARRFLIATGSSPAVPEIPGLDGVAYFTNETIFDTSRKLERLVIIGGDATALELAQAHLRLGAAVTVLAEREALAGEDGELAAITLRALRAEGIDIREGAKVDGVQASRGGVRVAITWQGAAGGVEGSHLLIAAGRRPNVSDLNLGAAGIKSGPNGIAVNATLRTSNRRVYAIGDVTGGRPEAHLADYHAGVFLKRVLFRLRSSAQAEAVPRVTFTSPEIAWIGLDEAAARAKHGKVSVLRWPYAENDRAQAERATLGHVKVITSGNGDILGAGIVGAQASELIQVWSLAISQGLGIRAMTEWVAPHPTLSQINRQVALNTYASKAVRPLVRSLVRFLGRFG
jgi:pyruvate/2-oxoglutarate dehydrogenase complex dihydrolipoamide dehydrogenase (E3) component